MARFDINTCYAGSRELVLGIKELELTVPPLNPATHRLTDLQRRALLENVRLVIRRTIAEVKTHPEKRESLELQMRKSRFQFLNQVPEARQALAAALAGTGVVLP